MSLFDLLYGFHSFHFTLPFRFILCISSCKKNKRRIFFNHCKTEKAMRKYKLLSPIQQVGYDLSSSVLFILTTIYFIYSLYRNRTYIKEQLYTISLQNKLILLRAFLIIVCIATLFIYTGGNYIASFLPGGIIKIISQFIILFVVLSSSLYVLNKLCTKMTEYCNSKGGD